jgi:hypothetical protein
MTDFYCAVNNVMGLASSDQADGIAPRKGIEICHEICSKWKIGHEKYFKAIYDATVWHRKRLPKA